MPATRVIYFRDEDGSVPALDWLTELARRNRQATVKWIARIELLRELGHELRRPVADYLRDGIYELRVRAGKVNYRMLDFFHGHNVVVLAHGLTKKKQVPGVDIERALTRKTAFELDPAQHTYEEEVTDGEDN